MMNDDLRNVMVQLQQGLSHVEEALRLAELVTHKMFCICPISDAKDLIQRFLKTAVLTSGVSGDRWCNNLKTAKSGWNPMRSQFPGITGFYDRQSEIGYGHGCDQVRSTLHCFDQNQNSQSKSTLKALTLECSICNVNCNSESQWKQHIDGQHHKARLAVMESLQRTRMVYPPKWEENGFSKRFKLYSMISGKVERKQSREARTLKMKGTKIEKRRSYGKRQQVLLLRCELCNITCNGNLQYVGHINGKRHQMAVEQKEKKCIEKL